MSHYQIPGATRETIRVGETEVSYQRIGNGPNLVFVHGWPLNGNTWRNVVSYLRATRVGSSTFPARATPAEVPIRRFRSRAMSLRLLGSWIRSALTTWSSSLRTAAG